MRSLTRQASCLSPVNARVLEFLNADAKAQIGIGRAMKMLVLAAAALCCLAMPSYGQTAATVRVATLPVDAGAEVFYAKDMGFFAKAGLDVSIESIQNSNALAAAVLANAVDIGYVNFVSIAAAHQKNIPFVAIAPGALYSAKTHSTALLASAGSPIRIGKDLNGKVVATQGLGTINEYGARAWVDQNGGDSSSVKFVEVAFSEMPTAIAAGRVDAAVITEPYLTQAKRSLRVIGYPFDVIAPEVSLSAWTTTSAWAKEHPDLVSRFAAAIRETAVWANKNQAKSGEILAKYTRIDPATVAAMVRVHYAERLAASTVQAEIDISAKYGRFSTFPAQDLIYKGPN